MDPPQKWFPFLHRIVRSHTPARVQLTHRQTPNTPVPEAHCPRRVAWHAVNDAQNGGLGAVLSLPTFAELHLLCRHTAAVRYRGGAWWCALGRQQNANSSDLKSSETNLLVHSWASSLQLR